MSNIAKFLMLLLIGIVIAVISLWLVGGKKQSYEAKVSIEAPADVIFSYLIDGNERKRWQVGLIEYSPTSETQECVGAQATTLVEVAGEQVEYEEKIIRYQKNEFLSTKGTGPKETSTAVFRLEQLAGSTNLTYKVKAEPTGFSRLMAPFAKPQTQERIADEVLRLKQLVEEENPSDGTSQYDADPTISAGADDPEKEEPAEEKSDEGSDEGSDDAAAADPSGSSN